MLLFKCLVSLAATACILLGVDASSRSRNPLNYLSLLEYPRIQTVGSRVHASSHFDLTFDLHQQSQQIKLSLEPNHGIFGDNAYITYLDSGGNIRHAEKIERADHKVFQGHAWILESDNSYTHVGWARIVVRRDGVNPLFEGAFTVMGDHHHIQMGSNYMQTKHELDPDLEEGDDECMTVFRDSDISRPKELRRSIESKSICAAHKLKFNSNPNHPVYRQKVKRADGFWGSMPINALLSKRQGIDGGGITGGGNSAGVNLTSTIGSSTGCPTDRKVALIGIATDCSYTAQFNSSDSVREHVITQVNTASQLYQSMFNVVLAVQNLTVSEAECPASASSSVPWNVGCTQTTTISDRLSTFSQWRGQRQDSNAYWSLFSTCNTGAEVGLAWLGQLCNNGASSQADSTGTTQSVSGANVVVRTSTEWQVFAHESGHTFGAVHDCDAETCADGTTVNAQQCCPLSSTTCDAGGQYIMNPASDPGITGFSQCTLGNICSALGRNSVKSSCLSDNKGVTTILAECGNGIVEEGEECDCGGTVGCGNDPCCDPTTCKFTTGSVCDPSNEGCCSSSCQFNVNGTVCRPSTGSCDPQETCTGTSGSCPPDVTAPDGTTCGTSGEGLECASGQCTSRDLQCKTVMGSYTQGNDTYACNSQTCVLSCASPEFGPNVCYSMQQNFLDGTPCGGGGKCSNGACVGSTVGGELSSWIHDNKTLVIALASTIGGLLILAILSCIVRSCLRPKKHRKGKGKGKHSRSRHTGGWQGQGWDGPMPPPMEERGGQWGTPPGQAWYAQPPPPMYGGGQSVRYA